MPDGPSVPRFSSTWFWEPPADPSPTVAFLARHAVPEVAVAVPWDGPSPVVVGTVRALRAAGCRVSALGAENSWVLDPGAALAWAGRALLPGLFDGVHLDVEFWTLPRYHGDPRVLVDGFVELVGRLRRWTGLPVDVDLAVAPDLVDPADLVRIAAAASGVTLLAYRDSADALLEFSASARRALARSGHGYRLGVETQPVTNTVPAHVTFGDDGRVVLHRELLRAEQELAGDPLFRGWAVHHLDSWRDLQG